MTFREIEFSEISQLDNPLLVDVREEDERQKKNIGGLHIPLQSFPNRLDEIDLSRPVVIYCAGGFRSAKAAELLSQRFPQAEIYSLKGGIGRSA